MELGVEFVSVDVEKLARKERKQKKKDKKKLRKEKRSKAAAKPETSPPSSDSEGLLEDVEGEYHAPEELNNTARDDWMTAAPKDRNVLTGEKLETREEKAPAVDEKPKVSAKELNPIMAKSDAKKPGSSGAVKPKAVAQVGDGGASWRLKALKRAQTLAEEEGRTVDDVISERHGSLAKLTEQLTSQRAAHSKAHLHAQRDRLRQKEGVEAGYLQDVGSGRSQMRRPDSSKSLSWRKQKPSEGARDTFRGDRHSQRDGRAASERSERGMEGDKEAPHARKEGGQSRRDPLGRPQDATVLRAAAASLNTFDSDGGFMERFQVGGEGERRSSPPPLQSPPGGSRDVPAAVEEGGTESSEPGPAAVAADGGNKSAAAALRARLLGKGLAQTKQSGSGGPESSSVPKRKQVELLPSVDAEGRAMPGAFGRDAAGQGLPEFGRKPKRVQRYEEGEKQRYYADDDSKSLDDLVREQKHGGGRHMDANLAENIALKSRFRERDLDVDDEYDVDGGLDMYESRNSKVTKEKAVQRQRKSQIADLRRSNTALDNCSLCFSSGRRAKHLTIAIGQTAYIGLPSRSRLAPLHCCIIPMEHVASARKTDEHVWTEMRNFKKCVIQMYRAQGLNAVFWETAGRLSDMRSHAVTHCVPVGDAAFHRAPIVFRKAMQEAESEWSQHHAKAVIDTRAKGLRGSVPPNFPYFFVEFGLSEGLLHVIDDEEKFDRDFGRSVMAGILALGAEVQHRGARPEPPPVQQKLATDFAAKFDPYDWTKQLD